MKIGAVMFFTSDSMQPAELAIELEQRGFESLWVPEHTHIPLTRRTSPPSGGSLIRPYFEINICRVWAANRAGPGRAPG